MTLTLSGDIQGDSPLFVAKGSFVAEVEPFTSAQRFYKGPMLNKVL